MKEIQELLKQNREWARQVELTSPGLFSKLAAQQKPRFLWIGCSDSRVPANQITGLAPGEVFVHRNISNQVINTDMNLTCVLQYAVEVLRVRHIIVCGHYGCGGVQAVYEDRATGILEHWLESVKELHRAKPDISCDRLCELNVLAQVKHLSQNSIVQRARRNRKDLYIHGWIYSISNGLIRDLTAKNKKRP